MKTEAERLSMTQRRALCRLAEKPGLWTRSGGLSGTTGTLDSLVSRDLAEMRLSYPMLEYEFRATSLGRALAAAIMRDEELRP